MSTELISMFPDKPWNWYYVSQNPNITWEFICNNPDLPWNWQGITLNPNITPSIIQNNPDKPWNIYYLTNITFFFIKYHKNKLPLGTKTNWNWNTISKNATITWDIIKSNPNIPWDWDSISENPNITWDIIRNNPDYSWNWRALSIHKNITFDTIKKLSSTNLNLDIIISHPYELHWDLYNILNITWDIVKSNPNIPWDWSSLSKHPNITPSIIQNNPDYPWDWEEVSYNPTITVDFINDNINKRWNWNVLSFNKFNHDPYFQSSHYNKKMTKLFHDTIHEELIKVSCHPRRVLYWNEDVNDPDNPYYGLTQEDINKLYGVYH